ncbi:MAG TPA: serine/threonine-protein kinase [Labilithrix sp.]
MPRVGDVIADKYRIEKVLGSGAMGVVVKAWHLVLDHPVALKFVHPTLCAHPEALRRFALEARSAARLRCEHAVRIYDVDRMPDGAPYIVMELLEGEPLSTIGARGPLLPLDVARWMIEACEALAEAHDAGVVHRDVKPDNLFLSRGVVKVLDFGLAKCLDAAEGTNGQFALGSPQYMSPEQVRGLPLDRRTDVWSLGATFYELLTGRAAYDAPSAAAVFACIVQLVPAPPRSIRPDIPEALADVVMRCLRHDPNERFADARLVARAIEQALTYDARRHMQTVELRPAPSLLATLAGPALTLVVALSCACVGLAARRSPAIREVIALPQPQAQAVLPPPTATPEPAPSPEPKPGARRLKPVASKKRGSPYDRP